MGAGKKRGTKDLAAESEETKEELIDKVNGDKHNTKDNEYDDFEDINNDDDESVAEMSNFMTMFQNSFAQNAKAKRRKTEVFTNASIKLSAKKIEEITHRQCMF